MPHISNYLINGLPAPSVNEVTGCLSLEGLIRNFWRPKGFEAADKITDISRKRGIDAATALENCRKGIPYAPSMFTESWVNYQTETGYVVKHVEPHLESKKYHFHGSPDGLGNLPGEEIELFDDKVKDKAADYKILMNESAYAQCWLEMHGEAIKQFRIFTYATKTGKLSVSVYTNLPQYFEDFLKCREMLEVNRRSERYYDEHVSWRRKKSA